jgi:hypothetical protein
MALTVPSSQRFDRRSFAGVHFDFSDSGKESDLLGFASIRCDDRTNIATATSGPVFSVRSPALDGASWVRGGLVEIAVGWSCRVQQNRRRRLLPPLDVAPCGSSMRSPVWWMMA